MVKTYFRICKITKGKMFYCVRCDVICLFLIFLPKCFVSNSIRGSPKNASDKEFLLKGVEEIIENKVEVRCCVCNQRMFDYLSGDFLIEIKCSRCKKVNILQGRSDKPLNRTHLVYIHNPICRKENNLILPTCKGQ